MLMFTFNLLDLEKRMQTIQNRISHLDRLQEDYLHTIQNIELTTEESILTVYYLRTLRIEREALKQEWANYQSIKCGKQPKLINKVYQLKTEEGHKFYSSISNAGERSKVTFVEPKKNKRVAVKLEKKRWKAYEEGGELIEEGKKLKPLLDSLKRKGYELVNL